MNIHETNFAFHIFPNINKTVNEPFLLNVGSSRSSV